MSILTWAVVAPRSTSTTLPLSTFRAPSFILVFREGRMPASYASPRRSAQDLRTLLLRTPTLRDRATVLPAAAVAASPRGRRAPATSRASGATGSGPAARGGGPPDPPPRGGGRVGALA